MAILSTLVSGTIFMLGIMFKYFIPNSIVGSLITYFGGPSSFIITQFIQNIYKDYKYNQRAQDILFKYVKDIDISIKENVLDITKTNDLENFLDYNFILSQTNFELNNFQKKIYINESIIEEVFTDLNKYLKLTKYAGLVIGDIGVGKTTLINELLQLPDNQKGLTETLAGESVTLGDPIRFNNPNYCPWLILYDTQGFDKDTNFVENIKGMKNYIESKFKSRGNEFVNFIIYCIHGERFTKTEKENIILLHNLYLKNKLPIIVINTRGLSENSDSLLQKIKYDMEKNYKIKDLIYLSVSAKKSKYKNQQFETLNLDKLLNIITNIAETSMKSTIYKLFYEKIKQIHERNINSTINDIDIKNISNFHENYKTILEKYLKINVTENTLNTMKTHYFRILEKDEIKNNVEINANKLREEFEVKTKQLIKQEILDEYKKVYNARATDHCRNGTLILMKKLLNEDFIFKDILEHLQKSHKIELYIDQLIKNFKMILK